LAVITVCKANIQPVHVHVCIAVMCISIPLDCGRMKLLLNWTLDDMFYDCHPKHKSKDPS